MARDTLPNFDRDEIENDCNEALSNLSISGDESGSEKGRRTIIIKDIEEFKASLLLEAVSRTMQPISKFKT